MRVAIIGFGGWGQIHAASVQDLSEHELTAIACRTEESAARARELYPQAQVFTNYQDALTHPAVEAVHVVTPSHLHVEVALAALDAGKHVLLEKPMATTIADADRLVDAARHARGTLSIVHELRLSHQWRAVKDVLERGEIGTPHYALLNLFRFPYRSGADNWRYDQTRVGSWVLEEPIHFIDLLQWYMADAGSVSSVTAFVNEHSAGLSREFTAVLRLGSGAYGVVSQTLSAFEHHQVVEITGSAGAVRSLWSGAMDRTDHPEFSVTVRRTGADTPERIAFDAPSGELFEIREFIDQALHAMQEGRPLYTAEDERELIRVCLAAEESARTGRTVPL